MSALGADSQAAPDDRRKTVFLVDRSDSFVMYLRILIERMGFRSIMLVSRTNSLREDIVAEHIRLGQKLKRQQLQLRNIMEVLPSGLRLLSLCDDGALEPLAANPAPERLLGAGARGDRGAAELLPEGDAAEIVRRCPITCRGPYGNA